MLLSIVIAASIQYLLCVSFFKYPGVDTTISRQTVSLVLDTIRLAMKKEKKKAAAELQLHSDQGFQYTSQAYFKLTQSYGIIP